MRIKRRAGGERLGYVTDVHRLLGVLRATKRAHTGPQASPFVARNPCPCKAEGLGTAFEESAVLTVCGVRHWMDVQLALDLLKVWQQEPFLDVFHAKIAVPGFQHI